MNFEDLTRRHKVHKGHGENHLFFLCGLRALRASVRIFIILMLKG